MKTKTFDCVEMKRRGAAAVYEKVKGMAVEEEIAYWKTRGQEMARKRRSARRRRA